MNLNLAMGCPFGVMRSRPTGPWWFDDFNLAHVDFDEVLLALGVSPGGFNASSMVFGREGAILPVWVRTQTGVAFGEDVDGVGLPHVVLWIPAY